VIYLPAATSSITLFRSRPRPEIVELRYQGLPRFDGSDYQMHIEIGTNDISVICPAIPVKLM
jgi:hypothetical protein